MWMQRGPILEPKTCSYVKSFSFVFNTILFFQIITTIHLYHQYNASPNIADFSAPMGHKIFHLYISLNDSPPPPPSLCISASQPEKCWTRHQQDHLQKAENTECQPTFQNAITPSIQMFACPTLCGSSWKHYPVPPPGGSPQKSSPSPSKKQSYTKDSCQ